MQIKHVLEEHLHWDMGSPEPNQKVMKLSQAAATFKKELDNLHQIINNSNYGEKYNEVIESWWREFLYVCLYCQLSMLRQALFRSTFIDLDSLEVMPTSNPLTYRGRYLV